VVSPELLQSSFREFNTGRLQQDGHLSDPGISIRCSGRIFFGSHVSIPYGFIPGYPREIGNESSGVHNQENPG
jgi:hypothetical protein